MGAIVGQIIAGIVITEAVTEVLDRAWWFRKARAKLEGRFVHDSMIGEFIRCKYCQSWWVGWAVALGIILWSGTWSWDWLWMGIVMQRGANLLHGVHDWLLAAKLKAWSRD